jgi:hypothetical protein
VGRQGASTAGVGSGRGAGSILAVAPGVAWTGRRGRGSGERQPRRGGSGSSWRLLRGAPSGSPGRDGKHGRGRAHQAARRGGRPAAGGSTRSWDRVRAHQAARRGGRLAARREAGARAGTPGGALGREASSRRPVVGGRGAGGWSRRQGWRPVSWGRRLKEKENPKPSSVIPCWNVNP